MKYNSVLKTFVDDDYRLEDHLDFKKQHADIKNYINNSMK
ncbi:Uncharacterised protein [Yersinia pseudotuberculosis]|nr:Uncharacterised protein [Yersinia pseudotuberculosis]CNB21997.1 Uncharacterised protein [Yersinia pseudotuberculosis]CNB22991.1 Uncharacterised protein [Yersinia pseudotuberculosis]CRY58176.1 Uncharacterised protein [Yersinia pseudotuberculosis]SUB28778.1 Uncharacterised protein [Yersinia pseudotuberculosis]